MEIERKQFTFYRSFWDSLKVLPDDDFLPIIKAVIRYALDEEESELSPLQNAFFQLIKPTLNTARSRAENGLKGGKANKKQTQSKNEANAKQSGSEEEKEKEDEVEKENEYYIKGKNKKFIPPTVNEVSAYCAEHGYSVNAQAFIDYYGASDWYRGKTKIKDWKKCLATWEHNKKEVKSNAIGENSVSDDWFNNIKRL